MPPSNTLKATLGLASIVEVGLRDGLQGEKVLVPLETRQEMIRRLIAAGARNLEVGSFVSNRKVPQMAESKDLARWCLQQRSAGNFPKNVQFSVLVANRRGAEEASEIDSLGIAVFTATSETFNKRNSNCTIDESFKRIDEIVAVAKQKQIPVRGYLSTVFGCPYEGWIEESRVLDLIMRLLNSGINEISLGDTIGVASPRQVSSLLGQLKEQIDLQKIAMHFHDTRGLALCNIYESLQHGIRIFDSSISGLGGCPFAEGASGNVATEDVVYLLGSLGIETKINLELLIELSRWLSYQMKRPLQSPIDRAGVWKFESKFKKS